MNLSIELFVGIRHIIVGMVENEQGYEDFMDTSVQHIYTQRYGLKTLTKETSTPHTNNNYYNDTLYHIIIIITSSKSNHNPTKETKKQFKIPI